MKIAVLEVMLIYCYLYFIDDAMDNNSNDDTM